MNDISASMEKRLQSMEENNESMEKRLSEKIVTTEVKCESMQKHLIGKISTNYDSLEKLIMKQNKQIQDLKMKLFEQQSVIDELQMEVESYLQT